MKKIALFSIITFLGISLTQAQISFQAIPQKKEVGLNEPIRIQFILSIKNKEVRETGRIKLPAFTNAQVIERQMIQNQGYDNDGVIIEYGIGIGMRAIKTGNIKIGVATVVVDGKTYSTKPITITVNNVSEQEERTSSSSRMGEAFLVLKVSDKNPYQNEGVFAQLKFYTRRIELLKSMTHVAPPNFQGLFVQPIKGGNNSHQEEVVNGEDYLSRVISSYVMFPSKSGLTTIEPFTLTLTIPDGFFEDQEIYIKSAPISLQVKKLPEPTPKDFYGVVGDYKIKAVPNKSSLKVNESATINIEITGKGNIGLVKTPSFIIPEGIGGFTPKSKMESVPSSEGVLGKISTSTVLVPHQSGKYDIKVKSFSFFDPEEKKYKKLSVEPITLTVLGDSMSNKKSNSILPLTSDSMKSKTYIPDIKVKEVISDVLEGKEKSNKILLITIGVLATLGVVYFAFVKKKKGEKKEIVSESKDKSKLNKLESLSQETQKKDFISELFQLKKIVEKGENKKEFYTLLESILQQAINQNLGISKTQFITSAEKDEKLSNKFGDEFSEECKNLLLKSQIERYSNLSDEGESLASAYLKTEELVNRLNN